VLRRPVIAAAAALAAGVYLATPTSADPGDNPCEFAINYFCKFIPIAPDLEGDVDLTTDQPPADPNAPPPESLPVVDPCAAGCI
jgi:hypothetical protein